MLSKIIFAMMLTTSVVQVQAMETGSPETQNSLKAPTRLEMGKAIYDTFYKESEIAKIGIQIGNDLPSMRRVSDQMNLVVDTIKSEIGKICFSGYEKAFEQLTDEVMQEFYALAIDPTVRDFVRELSNNSKDGNSLPLSGGFAYMNKVPTLPSTVTLSQVIKQLGSIKKYYNDHEEEILRQAHKSVKDTFGETIVHEKDLSTFLQERFPHLNAGQLELISAKAQLTFCPSHNGFHTNLLADKLTTKFGHILWNGQLSEKSWKVVANSHMDNKSGNLLDMLFSIISEMRPLSDKGDQIQKLSSDQENNILLGTVLTLNQLLEEKHKEGFLRYEDFFKTHGTQLQGLQPLIQFLNSQKIDEATPSLKELAIQSLAKNSFSREGASSSPTGKVCPGCGKVHGSMGGRPGMPSFEEFVRAQGKGDLFEEMMMDGLPKMPFGFGFGFGGMDSMGESTPKSSSTKSGSDSQEERAKKASFSFFYDDSSSESEEKNHKGSTDSSDSEPINMQALFGENNTSSSTHSDTEEKDNSDSETMDIKPLFDETNSSNASSDQDSHESDDETVGSGNNSIHDSENDEDARISDEHSSEEGSEGDRWP